MEFVVCLSVGVFNYIVVKVVGGEWDIVVIDIVVFVIDISIWIN